MIKYENKSEKFASFNLEGYEVSFPYEPYQCQKDIILNIMKGIKNNKNAIIESPTGTGKCLSALSAIMAYFKKINKNSNYKEETKIKENIIKILMLFEEYQPKLVKLQNCLFRNHKAKSLDKLISYFKQICENSKEDISRFEKQIFEILVKPELLLEHADDIDQIIARHIVGNYNSTKFKGNQNQEKIINQLNFFYDKILVAYNKLKDRLKQMKYSHSVIYAVRTSSQIDIVYEEFKKLDEDYNFAYLKSRDFYCINNNIDIYRGNTKNRICSKLVKKSKCESHKNFKQNFNKNNKNTKISTYHHNDFDFEFELSLKTYKEKKICPYYSEKEKAKYADVIVCTYNYLFTRSTKESWIDLVVKPIIIIDEAHNIISSCEDQLNFKICLNSFVEITEKLLILYENYTEKISVNLPDENMNKDDKREKLIQTLMSSKKAILFFFIFCYNLIFLNEDLSEQNENHEKSSDKEMFEYSGSTIFKIFSYLLDPALCKEVKKENLFYKESLSQIEKLNDDLVESNSNNLYEENETTTPGLNIKIKKEDEFSSIEKFKDKESMLNLENFQTFVHSLFYLNEEYIDTFKKEINELDKFASFLNFLFSSLINNFYLVFNDKKNKNIKNKPFIDDYFLVTNTILKKQGATFSKINTVDFTSSLNDLFHNLKELGDYIEEIQEELNHSFYNLNNTEFDNDCKFILNNPNQASDIKFYKMIHQKLKILSDKFKFNQKYLNLICMNPGISFRSFRKNFNPSSIILLSGTLNPFEYYSDQLLTEFHFELQNNHIVDKSNLNFYIFLENIFDESNFKISFSKENYDNLGNKLLIESFNIIEDFSNNSGRGNLIFMKTYAMLNNIVKIIISSYEGRINIDKNYKVVKKPYCIEILYKNKIQKRFFTDSNLVDSKIKESILNSYKKSCSDKIKSYLISVMRGLFSEGVNFEKEESSMIFVLGIPFPDLTDDYVRLKRCYLSKKFKNGECPFDGNEWYAIQAMTALNQTLGRAIRRKNDFSTICILESSILKKNMFKLFSSWVKEIKCDIVEKNTYKIFKERNKSFFTNFVENIDDFSHLVEIKPTKDIGLSEIFKIRDISNGFVRFTYK